jgi:hypothetical protein
VQRTAEAREARNAEHPAAPGGPEPRRQDERDDEHGSEEPEVPDDQATQAAVVVPQQLHREQDAGHQHGSQRRSGGQATSVRASCDRRPPSAALSWSWISTTARG